MWHDDARLGWPTVTILPDGWYRVEVGGRVGVGPDAESALRDLDGQAVGDVPAPAPPAGDRNTG
jgi:hypothetical protein